MNVGTAKPDRSLVERIPHHLIDIVDPDEQFSAGEFVRRAESLVQQIGQRGGVPVVSGGTPFYFRNLCLGLPETPAADRSCRRELQEEAEVRGLAALYGELERLDPSYAARVGSADRSRIIRALEVMRTTGRSLSSFAVPQTLRKDYRMLLIGLSRDREDLYRRIEERVDLMFRSGLADEVQGLRARGYGPEDPGMKGIGYREFFRGETDVRALVKRNTRRLAKRQMTFFRKLPRVNWIHAEDTEKVRTVVRRFLGSGGSGDSGDSGDSRDVDFSHRI